MTERITLENIIAFLKVDLALACCWPLPVKATKCQQICDKIFRLLSCLNGILMTISLIYTLSNKYDNMTMVFIIKVGCELTAFLQIPIQITLFTFQSNRLQLIIYEMEDYIRQVKTEEKRVFQQYINKSKLFYTIVLWWVTITAIAMIIGPLLLTQPFPIEVDYPFDINKQPLKAIIFLHHAIIIYQSRAQVCSNVFLALLLWFLAARFEIMSQKFQKVSNMLEFITCVQLHQQLLRYAKDVTITIRYMILSSIGFSTAAVIFSGLIFLSREPLVIKSQFFAVCASALIEVFLCTWPADYLLNTSKDTGYAGYESLWYSRKVSLQKDMLYIMSRCQYPVTLSIPCLIPTLSLNYYASYVSTTFSYLTTFRVLLAVEE